MLLNLKSLRKETERVLRTELLLSMMEDDSEQALPQALTAGVVAQAAEGLSAAWQPRVQQYVAQINAEYLYAMRKARLEYYLLNPAFRKLMEPLDMVIEHEEDVPRVEAPCTASDSRRARFEAAKASVAASSFLLARRTQQALVGVNEAWMKHGHVSFALLRPPRSRGFYSTAAARKHCGRHQEQGRWSGCDSPTSIRSSLSEVSPKALDASSQRRSATHLSFSTSPLPSMPDSPRGRDGLSGRRLTEGIILSPRNQRSRSLQEGSASLRRNTTAELSPPKGRVTIQSASDEVLLEGADGSAELRTGYRGTRTVAFSVFAEQQQKHALAVFSEHLLRWKTEVEGVLFDTLDSSTRCNFADEAAYRASDLHRFLQLVTHMMSESLRSLVMKTLDEFVAYVESHTEPPLKGHDLHWDHRRYVVCGMPPLLPSKERPLLVLKLYYDEVAKKVAYATSIRDARQTLSGIVDRIVDVAARVPKVEVSFLSALSLPPAFVPSVDAGEDAVSQLKRRLHAAFAICEEKLKHLLLRYEAFEPVLKRDPKSPLDPASFEDMSDTSLVEAKLDELLATRKAVFRTSPDDVHVHLFLADCSSIKQRLEAAVNSQIASCVAAVSSKVAEIALRACALYDRLWTELQLRPQTPESFDIFRTSTARMRKDVDAVEKRDFVLVQKWSHAIVERYYKCFPDDDAGQIYAMLQWPRRIKAALEESDELLKDEEEAFVAELQRERESLRIDVGGYKARVSELSSMHDYEQAEVAARAAQAIRDLLTEATRRSEVCGRHETIFNLPTTPWPEIHALVSLSTPFYRLWRAAYQWAQQQPSYLDSPLETLDASKTERQVTDWLRLARISVRALRGYRKPQAVARRLESEIAAFHSHVPWIAQLSLSGLRVRHWKLLLTELGCDQDCDITVSYLLKSGIQKHRQFVSNLTTQAKQEAVIERNLEQMKAEWRDYRLSMTVWHACKILVPSSAHDLLAVIEKHLMTTQLMRVDEYIQPFEKVARDWEVQLQQLQEVLTTWLSVQALWMSLKPIFDNEDVCASISGEARRFQVAHALWTGIMKESETTSKLIIVATSNNDLLPRLRDATSQLTKVQAGLSSFLNVRRRDWARLFWVTDREILSMLSSSTDLSSVDVFLPKCFDGVVKLNADRAGAILSMTSATGETVPLVKEIQTRNRSHDVWLRDLEQYMRSTLRNLLHNALEEAPRSAMKPWFFAWPMQIVLLALKVLQDKDIEDVLNLNGLHGLKALRTRVTKTLSDVSGLLYIRQTMAPLDREVVASVLLHHLMFRDKLDVLLANDVSSVREFGYQALVKHFVRDARLVVGCLHARHEYQYEYFGTAAPMVQTPLTDRVHRMLLLTFALRSAAVVVGPPCSGKTVVTRDLARQLGVKTVVIDCRAPLDWLTVVNYICGTVAVGAWCVFDAVSEAPSSIWRQLQPVLKNVFSTAKKQLHAGDRETFVNVNVWKQEEQVLRMNAQFYVSATVCVSRQASAIPTDLKELFRPCAVQQPDAVVIVQHLLYTAGCAINAASYAPKFVMFCRLAEGLLGLPPAAVLIHRICKAMRVLNVSSEDKMYEGVYSAITAPYMELRTLAAAFKLVTHVLVADGDRQMLEDIFNECFSEFGAALSHGDRIATAMPNLQFLTARNPSDTRYQQIAAGQAEPPLYASAALRSEMRLLLQQITLNDSLIYVSPAFSGKSTLLRALSFNHPSEHRPHIIPMCPRAMPASRLFGGVDESTGNRVSGVLQRILIKMSPFEAAWIVFESLVPDVADKLLSLVDAESRTYHAADGEKVALAAQTKLIVKMPTLADAPPPVVTKAAIFLATAPLEWKAVLRRWLLHSDDKRVAAVLKEFSSQALLLADFVVAQLADYVVSDDLRNASWICPHRPLAELALRIAQLYHAIIALENAPLDDRESVRCYVEVPVVHAAVVVFLGPLAEESVASATPGLLKRLETWCDGLRSYLPPDCTPLDCYPKGGRWSKLSDEDHLREQGVYHPTVSALRLRYQFDALLGFGVPLLLVGPAASGKTTLLRKLTAKPPEKYVPIRTTLSYACRASTFQSFVEMRLTKRRQGVVGPPLGEKCLLIVDDMHKGVTPHETTDCALEFLLSLIKYGMMYDADGASATVADLQVFGCSESGGVLSERFERRFFSLYLSRMTASDCTHVISVFFAAWMGRHGGSLPQRLAEVIVDTWGFLRSRFPRNAHTLHAWPLSDVFRVVRSMCQHPRDRFARKHSVLSLAAHELFRTCGERMTSVSDIEAFDTKILDIMSRCMRVQFSNSVAKPSDLLFTVLKGETAFVDAYSTQISVEDLTMLVQRKADDFFAKRGVVLNTGSDEHAASWFSAAEHSLSTRPQVAPAPPVPDNPASPVSTTSPAALPAFPTVRETFFSHAITVDYSWACIACKMTAALRQPQGHCVVVTSHGNDVLQVAALSAWMVGMSWVAQIEDHSDKSWTSSLSSIVRAAASKEEGEGIVWILSDWLLTEAAVADLCVLLGGRDLCGVLTNSFMQTLADESGSITTQASTKVASRVSSNLHFVIACSDALDALADSKILRWRRVFPSLVTIPYCISGTNLPSGKSTCVYLGVKTLTRTFLMPREDAYSIAEALYALYEHADTLQARCLPVRPWLYRQLLATFCRVYERRHAAVADRLAKLRATLQLLESTEQQCGLYVKQSDAVNPALIAFKEQMRRLDSEMSERENNLRKHQDGFDEIESACLHKMQQNTRIRNDCAAAMADVEPRLERATKALGDLEPKQITAIRCLNTPAPMVKKVLEAVVSLLGYKPEKARPGVDTSWIATQKTLEDGGFLAKISSLNVEKVPRRVADQLARTMESPGIRPEKLKSTFPVVERLSAWLQKVHAYLQTAKAIAPRLEIVKQEDERIAALLTEMELKRDEVQEQRVLFDSSRRNMAGLQAQIETICSQKDRYLTRVQQAQSLVSSLKPLRREWAASIQQLVEASGVLLGSCTMAAAVIVLFPSCRRDRADSDKSADVARIISQHVRMTPLAQHASAKTYPQLAGVSFRSSRHSSLTTESVEAVPNPIISLEDSTQQSAAESSLDEKLSSSLLQKSPATDEPLISSTTDLVDTLGCAEQSRSWLFCRLPESRHFTESAAIALSTLKTPVFTDSHGIALTWLKQYFKSLIVIKDTNINLRNVVRDALARGIPVCIDIDLVDPRLLPYLNLRSHMYPAAKTGSKDAGDTPNDRPHVCSVFLRKRVMALDDSDTWLSQQPEWFQESVTLLSFQPNQKEEALWLSRRIATVTDRQFCEHFEYIETQLVGYCDHAHTTSAKVVDMLCKAAIDNVLWNPSDFDEEEALLQPTILDSVDILKQVVNAAINANGAESQFQGLLTNHSDHARQLHIRYEPLAIVSQKMITFAASCSASDRRKDTGVEFVFELFAAELVAVTNNSSRADTMWDAEADVLKRRAVEALYRILIQSMGSPFDTIFTFLAASCLDQSAGPNWMLFCASREEVRRVAARSGQRFQDKDKLTEIDSDSWAGVLYLSALHPLFQQAPTAFASNPAEWNKALAEGELVSGWGSARLAPFDRVLLIRHAAPHALRQAMLSYAYEIAPELKDATCTFQDCLSLRGVLPSTPIMLLSEDDSVSVSTELELLASEADCAVVCVPCYGPLAVEKVQAVLRAGGSSTTGAKWLLLQHCTDSDVSAMAAFITSVMQEICNHKHLVDARMRIFFEVPPLPEDEDSTSQAGAALQKSELDDPPAARKSTEGLPQAADCLDAEQRGCSAESVCSNFSASTASADLVLLPDGLRYDCLKISIGHPRNVKGHLLKSLRIGPLTKGVMDDQSASPEYLQLLRTCVLFHAVMSLRQQAGVPWGGHRSHSWNTCDLIALTAQISAVSRDGNSTYWVGASHLIQDVVYGATVAEEVQADRLATLFIQTVDLACSGKNQQYFATRGDHSEQLTSATLMPDEEQRDILHVTPAVSEACSSVRTARLLQIAISAVPDCPVSGAGKARAADARYYTTASLLQALEELDVADPIKSRFVSKPKKQQLQGRGRKPGEGKRAQPTDTEAQPSDADDSQLTTAMVCREHSLCKLQVQRLRENVIRGEFTVDAGPQLVSVPHGWDEILPLHLEDVASRGAPIASLLSLLKRRCDYLASWKGRRLWLPAFTFPQTVLSCFTREISGVYRAIICKEDTPNSSCSQASGVIVSDVRVSCASVTSSGTIAPAHPTLRLSKTLSLRIAAMEHENDGWSADCVAIELPLMLCGLLDHRMRPRSRARSASLFAGFELPAACRNDAEFRSLVANSPALWSSLGG
ncbi:Dynein beta chain [Diplonema papillatum]|nr:Dynein beta chain [Diplonema papillatum]